MRMDEMLRLYKERAMLLRWEPTSYRELFLAENFRAPEQREPRPRKWTLYKRGWRW